MTLFLPFLVALQSVVPVPAPQPPPAIADNSFLIEEAYNQEAGVVQHINVFQRDARAGSWTYGFTQEWPLVSQRQQLSYTVSALGSGADGTGFGDVAINWRYQVVATPRVAIAPRASLTLPTGDSQRGHGSGGVGMQFNLPISVIASSNLILHSNAGTAIVPRARNGSDEEESTTAFWLGQSAIWPVRRKFHVMLEALWTHDESFVLNPGVRWAHDFASGLQIVPGVSIPVTYAPDLDPEWGVLAYLSLEHPFGRRR